MTVTEMVDVNGGDFISDSEIPECEMAAYGVYTTTEADDKTTVREIWELHALNYFENEILTNEGLTEGSDGKSERVVIEEIDHSRGPGVKYYLTLDDEGRPLSTLRMVFGDAIEDLPSFERCEQGFEDGTELLLKELIRDGHGIVEIAALAKQKDGDIQATFELYRKAFHDSLRAGDKDSTNSWFMGIVPKTLESLRKLFGEEIVEVLGEPQKIDHSGVDDRIELTPVLIQTHLVLDRLLDKMDTAKQENNKADFYGAGFMLNFFADGLRQDEMSGRVWSVLKSMRNGEHSYYEEGEFSEAA